MADINELIAQRPISEWQQVLERVENKDHPTRLELAALVERYGVSDDAREYVAARIRDDLHLGDGGRPRDPKARWARALGLMYDVQRLQAAFRLQGLTRPKGRALELVAKEEGIVPDTLDRIMKRGLRDAPHWMRGMLPSSITETEQMVREMVEDGTVRLDPELGLVWLKEEAEPELE